MSRNTYPMNFEWIFQQKDSEKQEIVSIPHNNVLIPYNNFDETIYQFQSIYTKKFNFSPKKDYVYSLRFEGVLHHSKVYVNQKLIGENHNGYSAFELDITDVLKKENTIEVHVDSRESLNQPPFGQTIDYLTFGGIYREVMLIEKPLVHIKDVRINQKQLLTDPTIELELSTSGGKNVRVTILDEKEIYSNEWQIDQKISISYPFQLWSPDKPKLYDFEILLDNTDLYTFRTGFKVGEFTSEGFFLNGVRTKITGLNRHQMYPYVGYAMPKNAQYDDVDLLQTMGNSVRTSHYPQSRHFYDRCDELGIMVFTEAPGWQYIGDEVWKMKYLGSIESMVKELKHHPSVILWGTRVNESGDDSDLYLQSSEIARQLDDRQTGGVRCFNYSELLEDVYTYNDFFHNGENEYIKDKNLVFEGEVPYLITEFNGHMFPTKSFDSSSRRLEHALRYAHILNAINKDDRICGSFGWSFSDYYTHNEFGSGDHICHHGVLDLFRMPKEAAYVYQSQCSKEPFMEILNKSFIGDYDAGYINEFVVASNCEYIDLYQDDRYVGRFYPNIDKYPHLRAPLFHIDDLIKSAKEDLPYSDEELKELLKIAKWIAKSGGTDKVTPDHNINSEKLQIAWNLYGKYIANWGSKAFSYKMIGFHSDKVITKRFGPYLKKVINVDVPLEMTIENTYDVAKVTITATDEFGNIMPYAFDTFKISVSNQLEIIGDSLVHLVGGKRVVWLRSVTKGNAQFMIENDTFHHNASIKVIEKKVSKL